MIDNEKIELNSKLTLNKKKNFGEVFTPKDLIEEIKKLSLKIKEKKELRYGSILWKVINIQRNISWLRQ